MKSEINSTVVKEFIVRNIVTITFGIMLVFGILMSKELPQLIMNELIQSVVRHSLLVLSLLIPIWAGMGFNFGIVIGGISGQVGVIMAVNWGLSGFLGFVCTLAFATPLAILLGIISGMVLNKTRGHEMITSLFIGYTGNTIYQFCLLSLVGVIIPVTSSKLILSSGVGLRNTVDLKDSLYQSLDGLLEVPVFLLLIALAVIYIALNIYRFKKNDGTIDRKKFLKRIIISAIVILVGVAIMYVDVLPYKISALKKVEIPLVTGILITVLVACHILIARTKIGKDILAIGLGKNKTIDNDSRESKTRITAIVISTVLASWGQIIFLQNSGVLITYGSHASIAFFSILALIVGGASFRKATVWQALLGVILVQGFMVISLPVFYELLPNNTAEMLRAILMNCTFLYAFVIAGYRNKKVPVIHNSSLND